MLKTAIGRLRFVGLLEGTSFLVLLYCSIFLKRIQGNDDAIHLPGTIHGALFILLCLLIQLARRPAGWSHRTCGKIFVAALVPFGPFLIEPWLKREDSRLRQAKGASRL